MSEAAGARRAVATNDRKATIVRAIGVNTWVWTSPLTDETLPGLLRHIAGLGSDGPGSDGPGFDAVELPLESAGDLSPEPTSAVLAEVGLAPYVAGVEDGKDQLLARRRCALR